MTMEELRLDNQITNRQQSQATAAFLPIPERNAIGISDPVFSPLSFYLCCFETGDDSRNGESNTREIIILSRFAQMLSFVVEQ